MQQAVTDEGVVRAAGVILQFVIAPAARAGVVGPGIRVDGRAAEFVGPGNIHVAVRRAAGAKQIEIIKIHRATGKYGVTLENDLVTQENRSGRSNELAGGVRHYK